jgi:hypothetical protein
LWQPPRKSAQTPDLLRAVFAAERGHSGKTYGTRFSCSPLILLSLQQRINVGLQFQTDAVNAAEHPAMVVQLIVSGAPCAFRVSPVTAAGTETSFADESGD